VRHVSIQFFKNIGEESQYFSSLGSLAALQTMQTSGQSGIDEEVLIKVED
jgi:hypothetical protein